MAPAPSARSAFAALSLALLFAASAAQTANFDFFVLGLVWPGSYCGALAAGCCLNPLTRRPAKDFFVTGLYPYRTNGPVARCSNQQFFPNLLQDLLPDLFSYWQNISCPVDYSGQSTTNAWRTVWSTYGTCSGMDEHTYFSTALTLKKRFDILTEMGSRGIVPNDRSYMSSEIAVALSWILGVKPLIFCNTSTLGKVQFSEIFICFNKDATTLRDCPATWKHKCPDRVLFPSFNLGQSSVADNLIEMLGRSASDL